jgi:hypothetical protein
VQSRHAARRARELVDVREDLPSSDYNGFMRKLEADVVDGGRAALARLAHTRPDVQCKASAARETQPAKLLAGFVVDTLETELVIPFGN